MSRRTLRAASLAGAALLLVPLALAEQAAPPRPAPAGPAPAKLAKKIPNKLTEESKEPLSKDKPSDYGLSGKEKLDGPFILRLRISLPSDAPAFATKTLDEAGVIYKPYIIEKLPDGGFFVFLRENPREKLTPVTGRYLAIVYSSAGKEQRRVDLGKHLLLSSNEIQDVRYRGGIIYFNEACQSYSKEVKGKCSSLVALDPAAGTVLWRSPYLSSNNLFIFKDDETLVSGYGFTAEPDYLFLLSAKTGEVLSRTKLDTAHTYLEIQDGKLHAFTDKTHYTFSFAP
jgi:hypothetical protein